MCTSFPCCAWSVLLQARAAKTTRAAKATAAAGSAQAAAEQFRLQEVYQARMRAEDLARQQEFNKNTAHAVQESLHEEIRRNMHSMRQEFTAGLQAEIQQARTAQDSPRRRRAAAAQVASTTTPKSVGACSTPMQPPMEAQPPAEPNPMEWDQTTAPVFGAPAACQAAPMVLSPANLQALAATMPGGSAAISLSAGSTVSGAMSFIHLDGNEHTAVPFEDEESSGLEDC